jgi:hypothetical protein
VQHAYIRELIQELVEQAHRRCGLSRLIDRRRRLQEVAADREQQAVDRLAFSRDGAPDQRAPAKLRRLEVQPISGQRDRRDCMYEDGAKIEQVAVEQIVPIAAHRGGSCEIGREHALEDSHLVANDDRMGRQVTVSAALDVQRASQRRELFSEDQHVVEIAPCSAAHRFRRVVDHAAQQPRCRLDGARVSQGDDQRGHRVGQRRGVEDDSMAAHRGVQRGNRDRSFLDPPGQPRATGELVQQGELGVERRVGHRLAGANPDRHLDQGRRRRRLFECRVRGADHHTTEHERAIAALVQR